MKRVAYLLLVVFVAGCDSGGEDLITRTYTIAPTATFLRVDDGDVSANPVVIDLASEGIQEGDPIMLVTQGEYFNSPVSTTRNDAMAIFSSSSTVLASNLLNRVPGAIDAGVDRASEPTFDDGQATDIPEDFRFDEERVEITVPSGATHLLIGNLDTKQSDNSATPGGFRAELSWE